MSWSRQERRPCWHCIAPRLDLSLDWSLQLMKGMNLAWTGVDLFFVLSGFLIGGILLDQGRANNFFQVFYVRRALRILPPYFLLLLSYLVTKMWLAPTKPSEAAGLLVPSPPLWIYGTFLQNFYFAGTGASGTPWLSATWSLAVEEQFYLCLPFLIFLVPSARLGPVLVGLIVPVPPSSGPPNRTSVLTSALQKFQPAILPKSNDNLACAVPLYSLPVSVPPDVTPW